MSLFINTLTEFSEMEGMVNTHDDVIKWNSPVTG